MGIKRRQKRTLVPSAQCGPSKGKKSSVEKWTTSPWLGKVVATTDGADDLQEAVAESEVLAKTMEVEREKAKDEEAKTARTLKLRKEMDNAIKDAEEKAKKEEQERLKAITEAQREKEGKDPEDEGSPWFTWEEIDAMDATVWGLLEKRGLPTSGKLTRLKERLAQLKAPKTSD